MKKTLEVNFFKKSGKWYMDEEIEIPNRFIKGDGFDNEGKYYYELRKWLRDFLNEEKRYSEFTAVCLNSEELGYPFMCHLWLEVYK